MYVRCINNLQYLQTAAPSSGLSEEIIPDLVVGQVYKVVPDAREEELGYLRVVDESGEDYTFPAEYFEAIEWDKSPERNLDAQLTVHISELDKAILRAEALASQKSVSALIREWIAERLDLPQAA